LLRKSARADQPRATTDNISSCRTWENPPDALSTLHLGVGQGKGVRNQWPNGPQGAAHYWFLTPFPAMPLTYDLRFDNALDYSEPIGWKFTGSIGYLARHCIVPREWGRLVCSTEACKHGSSESVGPVPLAQSRNLPAVMNAHCDTAGNFMVLAALNTAAEGKFRRNSDIFPRSTAGAAWHQRMSPGIPGSIASPDKTNPGVFGNIEEMRCLNATVHVGYAPRGRK